MEIITGFLCWCALLFIKIILVAVFVAAIVTLLLILVCFLVCRGADYLQDKIDFFTGKKPISNDTDLVPPSSSDYGDNLEWMKDDAEKDDYGINMEGMNGYPGGYGDEQMFEDEEEFHGMDYGLLDDEANDENNEI